MDDLRLGRAFRRVRLRRGWRQADVAERAGCSRSTCSEMERGRLDHLPLRTVRGVARVLEIDLDVVVRWRGGDLGRLIVDRHTAMSERVARDLQTTGWEIRPEVSFNHFGERGVVDLVARHQVRGTVLLVELKTELVDVGDLLATMDRRRRLGRVIANACGWAGSDISTWVVLRESRSNRRRLSASAVTLRAAFPHDGRAMRRWLRAPDGAIAALSFLPDSGEGDPRRGSATVKRVRRRSAPIQGPRSNVALAV